MAVVSGKVSRVKISAASATSSTNLAATLAAGGLVLSIDNSSQRHWNRNNSTALKVYDHSVSTSVAVSSTKYTVRWPNGQVVFSTAHSTSATYLIDTEWLTGSYLGQTRGWSLSVTNALIDNTAFSTTTSDSKWRTFKPGLSEWSVTLDRFHETGTTAQTFFDRLNAEQDVVVELHHEDQVDGWVGFGRVEGFGPAIGIEDLGSESVSIRGDDTLYYTTRM